MKITVQSVDFITGQVTTVDETKVKADKKTGLWFYKWSGDLPPGTESFLVISAKPMGGRMLDAGTHFSSAAIVHKPIDDWLADSSVSMPLLLQTVARALNGPGVGR